MRMASVICGNVSRLAVSACTAFTIREMGKAVKVAYNFTKLQKLTWIIGVAAIAYYVSEKCGEMVSHTVEDTMNEIVAWKSFFGKEEQETV